jgi:hypothetical protein
MVLILYVVDHVVDLAPDVAALFLNHRQRDKAVVDEDLWLVRVRVRMRVRVSMRVSVNVQ